MLPQKVNFSLIKIKFSKTLSIEKQKYVCKCSVLFFRQDIKKFAKKMPQNSEKCSIPQSSGLRRMRKKSFRDLNRASNSPQRYF